LTDLDEEKDDTLTTPQMSQNLSISPMEAMPITRAQTAKGLGTTSSPLGPTPKISANLLKTPSGGNAMPLTRANTLRPIDFGAFQMRRLDVLDQHNQENYKMFQR